MCALWASVNRVRVASLGEEGRFLPEDQLATCIDATVAWATILLAHRAYHCNPACPSSGEGRGNLWNMDKKWEVQNDWYTGGLSLALSYDVLYEDMGEVERRTVRSALALLVMKRYSWGNSEFSDHLSPNAELHPHRIFSNWAMYHSNLYLANLAIEGETDFDKYTTEVLKSEGETGFNSALDRRFSAMISAFLTHSFNPDGTTFEDGYSYIIALREGSLAMLAAHRRNIPTLDTPRFRNLVHNAAQLYLPWRCGKIMGHSSGGGLSYPAHIALFRYAYPNGTLPNMLWRMRMGADFRNNFPCRIEWHQNMVQLSILGDEHGNGAESMQGMTDSDKALIPTSFYGPRRGLLIARNSHSEDATLLHFDARPEAFLPGHDNADRGVFTLSALRRTWMDDLPWRENLDSRRHSLMHVDGLAQDEKAPSVKMLKVLDDGEVVLASADLTYAYNIQWARNWPDANEPTVHVVTYDANGMSYKKSTKFTVKETGDPRSFGWPVDDLGADIGLERPESDMHGDPDMGFRGMWTWKRDYRTEKLARAVRSTALVRSDEITGPGYVLVTDSFKVTGSAGNHVFESYLILGSDVSVDGYSSSCSGSTCKVILKPSTGTEKLDIHVMTLGTLLSYRSETFDGNNRLIIKSEGMQAEEFWMAMVPNRGDANGFEMTKIEGSVRVSYAGDTKFFKLSDMTHDLELTRDPTADPAPMPFVMLQPKKKTKIVQNQFSANSAEFLYGTSSPLQIVFKMTSLTPAISKKVKGDILNTCFPRTNSAIEMALFDCGNASVADEHYSARNCSLVMDSGEPCEGFGMKMRKILIPDKPYFLAISVTPGAGIRPRVFLTHRKGSV